MVVYDHLIRGGRVIDPANGIDRLADVAIKGGVIAEIARDIPLNKTKTYYDARNQIVTPGLIDIHAHVYEHVTPLGVSADEYCLRRGVTTVVDAGSTGYLTFPGIRRFADEGLHTRLLVFLNISSVGLAAAGLGGDDDLPGELESLKFASVAGAEQVIEANRDRIVGVKIRLSDTITNGGQHETEGFRRALALAERVQLPLMVHHAFSTVPLADCPGRLRPRDIYTHCYHGFPSTIIDPETGRVDASVMKAYGAGVRFDIGSGQGSFNWTVAERALEDGLLPYTISTDLHQGTVHGPTYDLPTVMTRMLHLGLSLPEIVAMTTANAAKAIGWDDRIGTLGIGRPADITALAVESCQTQLEDCQSQLRQVEKRIVARGVWRDGVHFPCTVANPWPNEQTIARQRGSWERLVVRDERHP